MILCTEGNPPVQDLRGDAWPDTRTLQSSTESLTQAGDDAFRERAGWRVDEGHDGTVAS